MLDKRSKLNGAPTSIDLLLPQYVNRVSNGELVEYIYNLPERTMRFDPMDVVHFKLPDPQRWQRGHSPVTSIRYSRCRELSRYESHLTNRAFSERIAIAESPFRQ